MKLTMLGLGPDASVLAKALLECGVDVMAYDPANPKNPVVPLASTAEVAVSQAQVVFSLNSATAAASFAREAAAWLEPGAIFCDLNAGTPWLKRQLAQIVPTASFVDAAILNPTREATGELKLSVSGQGARRLQELFDGINVDISVVSEVAGDAAARELIGGMVAKGMAAVAIDALWAAKEMGLQDLALQDIQQAFETSSAQTLQEQLDHIAKHAKVSSVELGNVVEMLSEAGHESTMLNGVAATLSQVMHGKRIPFANTSD